MPAHDPPRPPADWHISTGVLPPRDRVHVLLDAAWRQASADTQGDVSTVYPALERVPPDLFGVALTATDGETLTAGDADHPFTIMSVSKPFVLALACERLGSDAVLALLGANATGLPFNSVAALDRAPDGRTNPMVNPGAIMTTALIDGPDTEARWSAIRDGLARFAGRDLVLDHEVLSSAQATNHRNRGMARILHGLGGIQDDPDEAVELYTRQCSLQVTARDLAVMGATLAAGGINPLTGERVVDPLTCHHVLAVMATAGMYEASGDWLVEVGLPGKSGIAGGIVTVSPGKGALGTFSPRLDAAGNSVRGRVVARELSRRLGLDLFVSGDASADRAT